MHIGKLPRKIYGNFRRNLRKFWIVTVTMVVNLLEKIINVVTIKTSAVCIATQHHDSPIDFLNFTAFIELAISIHLHY
jgi:hypothetical protein